jgi:hypothetical protein
VKPSILGVVLAAALFLAPFAHADSAAVPIGDPVTDTLQLWNDIATSLSSLAHDFAFLFDGREFATNHAAHTGNMATQQQSLAAAAAATSPANQPPSATSSEPEQTPSTATSDQTTLSQNVKPAELTSPKPASANSSATRNAATGALTPPSNSNFVTQDQFDAGLSALATSQPEAAATPGSALNTSSHRSNHHHRIHPGLNDSN